MPFTPSLTAAPSRATPLQSASTLEPDRAGQTAFERIASAGASPASIPPHTPDWTNLNDSDPGVSLVAAFAWPSEAAAYRAVAGSEHRAHDDRTRIDVAATKTTAC